MLRSTAPHRRPGQPLRLEDLEARDVPALIGALDPSFNTTGVGQVANFGATDVFNAVALQQDGKIVAVGTTNVGGTNDFLVVRYNADGTIDSTFNNNTGKEVIDLGGDDQAFGVTVDSQNRIVVVGQGSTAPIDFAIVRLNPDGTLDTSFSGDGKNTITLGQVDVARAVGVQSDGTIVVAGFSNQGGTNDFAVIRVSGSGATAGNQVGATKFIDFGGSDQAFALAVYPVGTGNADQIVVVGQGAGAPVDFAVAKLSADLTTQTTKTFALGGVDVATGVEIQADGKIVVTGTTDAGGTNDFTALRVNADLSGLDTTYNAAGTGSGTAGVVRIDLGGNDTARGSELDEFGRVVIAGSSGGNLAVVRLTTAGALDTSLAAGSGGKLITNTVQVAGSAGDMAALQGNGRLVAAASVNGGADATVARLIASTELPNGLAIGGSTNGAVPVLAVDNATQLLNTTPVVTPTPIAGAVVNTALADVNGDGTLDLVVGATAGSDRVVVLDGRDASGKTVLASFSAFGGYGGGVFVAAGDLNNDGRAEVVVSPVLGGLGPRIAVFDGVSLTGNTSTPHKIADFNGIADANTGAADNSATTIQLVGARVAVGDVNGDGIADLAVAAGTNGGPRITIWDGKNVAAANGGVPVAPPLANAFVFEASQRDGAFVTLGDVTGDGKADLIAGGGPNGGPRVRIGEMSAILAAKNFGAFDDQLGVVKSNFFAGDPNTRGGIRVAARDVDGDGIADLVTGSGAGLPSLVQVFRGSRLVTFTSGIQTGDQSFDPFNATLAGGVFVG